VCRNHDWNLSDIRFEGVATNSDFISKWNQLYSDIVPLPYEQLETFPTPPSSQSENPPPSKRAKVMKDAIDDSIEDHKIGK